MAHSVAGSQTKCLELDVASAFRLTRLRAPCPRQQVPNLPYGYSPSKVFPRIPLFVFRSWWPTGFDDKNTGSGGSGSDIMKYVLQAHNFFLSQLARKCSQERWRCVLPQETPNGSLKQVLLHLRDSQNPPAGGHSGMRPSMPSRINPFAGEPN